MLGSPENVLLLRSSALATVRMKRMMLKRLLRLVRVPALIAQPVDQHRRLVQNGGGSCG